jgi:hypothetical protein
MYPLSMTGNHDADIAIAVLVVIVLLIIIIGGIGSWRRP